MNLKKSGDLHRDAFDVTPLGKKSYSRINSHEQMIIFGAPRMPPTPLREVFAKFSRTFFENVGAKVFSKNRSRRRDQSGPKIVKIRAILAIFRPFEVLGCQKSRNFERPFTPRGWLHSASNFGKARFRRSPTFHFSTAKTSKNINFLQNFERPFTH